MTNNAISEGMARAKARRHAAVQAGKLPTPKQELRVAHKRKAELAQQVIELLDRISTLEGALYDTDYRLGQLSRVVQTHPVATVLRNIDRTRSALKRYV